MASAGRSRNYRRVMIRGKLRQLLNAAVREITTGSLKDADLVTKIRFLKGKKEENIKDARNQTSDGSVGIILTETDLNEWDDKIKELNTQRREEIAAQLVAPYSGATAAAARKKAKKARKKEREKIKKRMLSGKEPDGGWLLPPLGEGVEKDELEKFTMKLKKDLESGGESKGGRRKRKSRKRKRRRTKKRKSRKMKRRSKRRKN